MTQETERDYETFKREAVGMSEIALMSSTQRNQLKRTPGACVWVKIKGQHIGALVTRVREDGKLVVEVCDLDSSERGKHYAFYPNDVTLA